MSRTLSDIEVKQLRERVQSAFSEYPKNAETVEKIIEQAIRSSYIRGYNVSRLENL